MGKAGNPNWLPGVSGNPGGQRLDDLRFQQQYDLVCEDEIKDRIDRILCRRSVVLNGLITLEKGASPQLPWLEPVIRKKSFPYQSSSSGVCCVSEQVLPWVRVVAL